jgi:hypothetical protein
MTLIELLVVMSILGLIVTVIAAALTVVIRQAPETVARVDTARWEQNLGTWLPADLTSAEWPVDTVEDPDSPDDPTDAVDYAPYEPCASDECTFGDNVAHFSWSEDDVIDVSYRYGQNAGGTFELRRVECSGGSCSSITLVRDMPAPSTDGELPVAVSFPPDLLSTDPNGSEIVDTIGRRVTVLINGENGIDVLSFAGGGAERVDLEAAAIQRPQFLLARSGCGGPISLIVDESGSLTNSDAAEVRLGVKSFVETFAGTPTQLQIIGFNTDARVLGAGTSWNHWYDLSEQSIVDMLLGGSSPIDGLDNNSATNWEDAIYRAFYTETGLTYEAAGNPAFPPAELVVFFTDGMPTYDRTIRRTGAENPGVAEVPPRFDYRHTTVSHFTQFSPRSWYRASWLLQQTATRVIGVGVGTAFGRSADLDRDTELPDSIIDDAWSAPYNYSGSGSGYSHPRELPAEVALGDLIAGNDVSNFSGTTTDRYVKVSYNGGWDPEAVKDADILATTDFSQFGAALESIALAECGGTLTVQTRKLSGGEPLTSTVTYEVTGADRPLIESSTSAVSKTAVFDISAAGGASTDILLKPRTLDGSGFTADHWTCRSRNVEITDPDKVAEANPAVGAVEGIELSVEANEAVSCILFVVPE